MPDPRNFSQQQIADALINTLDPHGPVAGMLKQELSSALPWLTGKALDNVAHDMLATRQKKERNGTGTAMAHLGIPAEEVQELIEFMAQPRHGVGGTEADALVHIYANLRAQFELHAALSDKVFAPRGNIEQAMVDSLRQQLPEIPEQSAREAAADFTAKLRRHLQDETEVLRPGGPVERGSVRLAKKIRSGGAVELKHHTGEVLPTSSRHLSPNDRFGHEIAYGMQQTLACFATDVIDPAVSQWYQNRYGDPSKGAVTAKHVVGAEVMGDFSAFFVYVGAKRFFGKQLDAITDGVKNVLDGFLSKIGARSLKDWRHAQGLEKDDPRYLKQLENYKEYQAENIVDSGIIAGTATLSNVGIQRALGNKQDMLKMILVSKVIGAVATLSVMFGLRMGVPDSMHHLDKELNDRYFSKIIRFTKKAMGVQDTPAQHPEQAPAAPTEAPIVLAEEQVTTSREAFVKPKIEPIKKVEWAEVAQHDNVASLAR